MSKPIIGNILLYFNSNRADLDSPEILNLTNSLISDGNSVTSMHVQGLSEKQPNSDDYDLLILVGWQNVAAIKDFYRSGKKIICIPFDDKLGYLDIKNSSLNVVLIGLPGLPLLQNELNTDKLNRLVNFQVPALKNYRITPKASALDKEEFFNKYKLDLDKKLVVFYLGRLTTELLLDNFDQNVLDNHKRVNQLINNWDKIKTYLSENKYQLIIKDHPSKSKILDALSIQNQKILAKKLDFLKDEQYLEFSDDYEVRQYADYAFSICTSTVYQLYLQDLAVLDFGSGCYFPAWRSTRKVEKLFSVNQYIEKYNNFHDLIFGQVITDEGHDNIEKTLANFFDVSWDINNFIYKNKNPLYGNTYEGSIKTIHQAIIDCLV